MSYDDVKNVLDPQQRQQNMDAILNSIQPDQADFNTMLLGFADIIQSTFYQFLSLQAANESAKQQLDDRLNTATTQVMQVLNKESLSNPEDMVILSTIMIEAISKSFIRQNDAGMRISQQLHNLKHSAR